VPPARLTTILVVEDDAELRALYRTALTMAGYSVVTVEDGLEALRWIDAHRPDGILLDIGLPRLSGHDVQREVAAHAETRDIPIIVITGRVFDDVKTADVACILRKPIDVEAVIAAARQCFPPPSGFRFSK
jgi:DNA-binding response OmpR family regulator